MLHEVELTRQSQSLLDAYTKAYKARYSIDPVMRLDSSDQTILRDICRHTGNDRALDLVTHYLTMDNEFFLERGHNLETLKKCLSTVNASLGKAKQSRFHKACHILTYMYCDSCGAHTEVVIRPEDMGNRFFCQECSQCPF